MEKDWSGTLTIVLAALLVAGGITYFWIGAAHRFPSHAARSGLMSGAVLGFLIACVVLVAANPSAASSPDVSASPQTLREQAERNFPLAPSRIVDSGADALLTKVGVIALPWPLFGVVGGLAIDRRWGKRIVHGAALSIFATALAYELLLCVLKIETFSGEMASHLSVALGWSLALIVCTTSSTLIPEEAGDGQVQS